MSGLSDPRFTIDYCLLPFLIHHSPFTFSLLQPNFPQPFVQVFAGSGVLICFWLVFADTAGEGSQAHIAFGMEKERNGKAGSTPKLPGWVDHTVGSGAKLVIGESL